MRGMLLVVALTGAITMSEIQTADAGQKDEKFPDRVSFRHWIVQGVGGKEKFFLPQQDNMKALFKETKDGPRWAMPETSNGDPTVGSEIISSDKDGNKTVWVVTKVSGGVGFWSMQVKKKDPPAKKD